jgi:hypothetical protein
VLCQRLAYYTCSGMLGHHNPRLLAPSELRRRHGLDRAQGPYPGPHTGRLDLEPQAPPPRLGRTLLDQPAAAPPRARTAATPAPAHGALFRHQPAARRARAARDRTTAKRPPSPRACPDSKVSTPPSNGRAAAPFDQHGALADPGDPRRQHQTRERGDPAGADAGWVLLGDAHWWQRGGGGG